MHIGRQVLLQILQGRFQAFGQLDGTRIGLFGYGDQHRRFPFFGSQSQPRLLGTDFHVGNVFQYYRYSVHPFDDRPAHFTYIVGRKYATHNVFVTVFINHSTVGVLVHVAGNFHYFAQCHAVVFHAFGMQQYLIFLDVATQNGHLCHTSGRKQARTDGPVGQRTQIEHGSAVGRQAHNQQLAQNGRLRSQGRIPHIVRQVFAYGGQFLGYNLTGQIDVRIPIEFHPHDGETRGGRRTYPAHMRGSIHRGLDGESHQLLHFFGGHTVGLGHDHYRRSIQVGKHVHFRMESGIGSPYQQQDRSYQYKQTVLQRESYDFIQHSSKE